jgi:hypothetical protein
MARRDLVHDAVIESLIQDGWSITDDPLIIGVDEGERSLEIDLAAERIITATKGTEMIAVEVKTFGTSSILNAFHSALGQYLDYRDALEENNSPRQLFLALPLEVFLLMEEIRFIMRQIAKYQLQLIVVDVEKRKIVSWKKN